MVDGVFGVVCCGVSGAVSSSTWHIRKSFRGAHITGGWLQSVPHWFLVLASWMDLSSQEDSQESC